MMDINLAVMLICVAFLLGATIRGFLWAPRKDRKSLASEPFCGCRHHLSMHDPASGLCHHEALDILDERIRCTCRRYVGPEPLSLVWAAPTAIDPLTGIALQRPAIQVKDGDG